MTETKKSWQYRAIEKLKGNQSLLGALVIAIAGRACRPPCIHPHGMKITRDGAIEVLYDDGSGWKTRTIFSQVEDFNDMFRGLASELGMSWAQREDMFTELRKFCFKDERVVSNLDGGTNYRKGRN